MGCDGKRIRGDTYDVGSLDMLLSKVWRKGHHTALGREARRRLYRSHGECSE